MTGSAVGLNITTDGSNAITIIITYVYTAYMCSIWR